MEIASIPTNRLEETATLLRQPNYSKQVEFFQYKQLDEKTWPKPGAVSSRFHLSEIEVELKRRG